MLGLTDTEKIVMKKEVYPRRSLERGITPGHTEMHSQPGGQGREGSAGQSRLRSANLNYLHRFRGEGLSLLVWCLAWGDLGRCMVARSVRATEKVGGAWTPGGWFDLESTALGSKNQLILARAVPPGSARPQMSKHQNSENEIIH